MSEQNISRRAVLKGALLSLAAIPVVVQSTRADAAAALPLVDPAKDPTAKALGYVANAATTKDPAHKAGAVCSNCALFQGKATDAAGGCPLFAGKQVAGAGWCSAWAKKA